MTGPCEPAADARAWPGAGHAGGAKRLPAHERVPARGNGGGACARARGVLIVDTFFLAWVRVAENQAIVAASGGARGLRRKEWLARRSDAPKPNWRLSQPYHISRAKPPADAARLGRGSDSGAAPLRRHSTQARLHSRAARLGRDSTRAPLHSGAAEVRRKKSRARRPVAQYRGTLGSTSMDQASMPPARLCTFVKPCERKNSAACWERPPWWQWKMISVFRGSFRM